jgi:hypothetical protein
MFEFEDRGDWSGIAILQVICDRATEERHLALRYKDETLCGIRQLDSKCRMQDYTFPPRKFVDGDEDYARWYAVSYGTNREVFEDATCEMCREHAHCYL